MSQSKVEWQYSVCGWWLRRLEDGVPVEYLHVEGSSSYAIAPVGVEWDEDMVAPVDPPVAWFRLPF